MADQTYTVQAVSTTSNEVNDGYPDINNPQFGEDGKLKEDSKAISNAQQALAIARSLQWDDSKRDCERARVLAAFNGEAPYCDSELKAAAQSYRFNLSFGFIEGVIGRATVPYNALVADNQYVANISGDLPEARLNIIRDELTEIIMKWGEWQKFTSRLNQDLVLNGWDNAIFPSDYDPWPIFVPQMQGFVHEMTPNSVKDLDVFVWKKTYMIHELYGKIVDKEAANKAGWNIDNVKDALEEATPESLFNNRHDGGAVKIEEAERGGSLYSSMVGGKVIETYHVFASEVNGEVTHYIVLEDGNYDPKNKYSEDKVGDGVELFKREKRFKRFEDMLVYFDLEPGDGKWHGSRGLGRRSFNTHKSLDKLRNAILDQSFQQGLTLLQVADQASQEDLTFMVVGPFAVIPAGVQVQATAFPTVPSTTFQVDQLLTATTEQRIGDVMPSAGDYLSGGDKTATQTRIEEGRKQAINKGNLQRYLDPLSAMMSIMVRRLLIKNSPDPYAKEFQAALKAKGITQEEMDKIQGARSTGRIDQISGNDAAAMQVVFAEFRGDPDVPQKNLKRRRISSLLGPKDAEDLVPDAEDSVRKVEAEREQKSEIGTLIGGITLAVSPRDIHEYHLPIVVEWIGGQIQGLAETGRGADPNIIAEAMKHAADHLSYLSQNKAKKELVTQMSNTLKGLKKKLDQLVENFQKNQQAAQEEQAKQMQAKAQLEQMGAIPPGGPVPAPQPQMQPQLV